MTTYHVVGVEHIDYNTYIFGEHINVCFQDTDSHMVI